MKTRAVRLYGEMDLRMEEFELPEMKEDEILARVISDSLCASTYKAAKQGSAHKRVPRIQGRGPIHYSAGSELQRESGRTRLFLSLYRGRRYLYCNPQ